MNLIIGCAGYIAKHLAKAMLESGIKVRGLVLPEQKEAMSELVRDGLELYIGDIRKKSDLVKAVEGADIVYNLSGLHSSFEKMQQVYVEGTTHLLELCQTSGVGKIILAGSGAVYGNCEDELITEEHRWNREHPFSEISCRMEEVANYFYRHSHLNIVILRIAEVYGEGEFNFYHKKITAQTRVVGKPDTYNSRIFIGDLVQILMLARDRLEGGEVYNVSDHRAATLKEFYTSLGTMMPKWLDDSIIPERILRSIHGLRAMSLRMSNNKLVSRLSYSFILPTYQEGIAYCRERANGGKLQ